MKRKKTRYLKLIPSTKGSTNSKQNNIHVFQFVLKNSSMIIIKVKIQDCDDLRRFSLEEKATFEEFSRVLSSIYPRIDDLLDTYSVKYTDDEGDLTSIESTESLADAIRQTSFLNPPVLRITLVPDKQRIDRSIQIPPSHSILFQGREITVPGIFFLVLFLIFY